MIKNNKGITLISLVVTIVVMLILAISLTASVTSTIELQEYNKVKEDIINLSEEVKVYYLKNKKLPVYTNREYSLSSYDVPTYDINPNDSGVYYAIDLTVLPEDLKLNCGEGNVYKDFSSDDLYVLDKESLTVYYLKGAVLNGEKHYTIVDDYNGGGFATDYYKKVNTDVVSKIEIDIRLFQVDSDSLETSSLTATSETVYIGLFSDKNGQVPASSNYMKKLEFKQSSSATITYTGTDMGTYYIFMVDSDGNAIEPVTTITDSTGLSYLYNFGEDFNNAGDENSVSISSDSPSKKIVMNIVYYSIPDGF